MWLQKGLAAGKLHKIQNKNEMTRASDQTTGEATDVTRGLRQVHMQSHTCDYKSTRQEWDDKSFRLNHGRRSRCKEKLETATKTETHIWLKKGLAREASAKYTDRDTHVISKWAGRRPAPQHTRQEWDDEGFRSNHGSSNRCKKKLERSPDRATHVIKKGAGGRPHHKIQDKNEMTRASDQTTGEATDVKRSLRQVHRQRHTCD